MGRSIFPPQKDKLISTEVEKIDVVDALRDELHCDEDSENLFP
jgi:hypothetical protein